MGALEKSLTKLGGGLETRLDKTEAQTQRLSRQLDKAGGGGGGGGGGGDSERMVQQLSEEAAATQLQLQQVIHSRQSVCCLEVSTGIWAACFRKYHAMLRWSGCGERGVDAGGSEGAGRVDPRRV